MVWYVITSDFIPISRLEARGLHPHVELTRRDVEYFTRELLEIARELAEMWFLYEGVPEKFVRRLWEFETWVERELPQAPNMRKLAISIAKRTDRGTLKVFEGYVIIRFTLRREWRRARMDEVVGRVRDFKCDLDVMITRLPSERPRKYLGYLDDIVWNSLDLVSGVLDYDLFPIAIEVRFRGRTPEGIVIIHTDEGPLGINVNTELIGEEDVREWRGKYGWDERFARVHAMTDSTLAAVGALDYLNKSDLSKRELMEEHLIETIAELEGLRRAYDDFTLLLFTYLPFRVLEL